ncbi:stressosome-associated protein Prli42 [Virgibacillus ainsalahensis]
MAANKRSKRERRTKIVVYIMIIAMLLSTFTAAFAMFI